MGVESKELSEFRKQFVDWLASNRPAAPPFALPSSFLYVQSQEQFDYLRAWQRTLHGAGYLGFGLPVEYGGAGVDPERAAVVTQELARASAPILVNAAGLGWVGPAILAHGTEEQKRHYLPRILSGDDIWCQGFSEPNAGSDLASLGTGATREGDQYVVNGEKVWTSLGAYSTHIQLLCRTDHDASKHRGISCLLLPMDQEGVDVRPLIKITGESGFYQVHFANAKASQDCLLGSEGDGWAIAMTTFHFERGAAQERADSRLSEAIETFRSCVELARESRRDGHAAIGDPTIATELATRWIDLTAIVANSARRGTPALAGQWSESLSHLDKLVYTEWKRDLLDLACSIRGSEASLPSRAGWVADYMNSFGMLIAAGTSEIHKNILAERVLGLPRSRA